MYRPLYELSNEYRALINEVVDTETGEIKGSELDFDALTALQDDIEHKVENIGIYYKTYETSQGGSGTSKELFNDVRF